MRYKLLEHTADAMVEAYGKDLGERFANAAYAMFDQITDIAKVEPRGEIRIELVADSREQLIVDFLQELLYIHDTEDVVLGTFEVSTDGRQLKAKVSGEKFDEKKHSKRSVVKGVTYHGLAFDDANERLTILFDV
jgi:SHS2 domain-containing protein